MSLRSENLNDDTSGTSDNDVGLTTRVGTIAAVVAEGKPAPEFSLTADSGDTIALSDFHGRPVVLYFYPNDDSLPPSKVFRMTDTTIPVVRR